MGIADNFDNSGPMPSPMPDILAQFRAQCLTLPRSLSRVAPSPALANHIINYGLINYDLIRQLPISLISHIPVIPTISLTEIIGRR